MSKQLGTRLRLSNLAAIVHDTNLDHHRIAERIALAEESAAAVAAESRSDGFARVSSRGPLLG